MNIDVPHLDFFCEKLGPDRSRVRITIDSSYVSSIYNYILLRKKEKIVTQGFLKGETPLSYIENTYKLNILESLKKLFLHHCVFSYLYKKLLENKIILSSEPVLKEVKMDNNSGAVYIFEILQNFPPVRPDWKKLIFKAPLRKNYRDLDKQVEHFVEEEDKNENKVDPENKCNKGDWILLRITLVDKDSKPLLSGYSDFLWLRLGDEFLDQDAYELLKDKKVGDQFVTTNDLLQEYLENNLDIRYNILVEIVKRADHSFFSLEQFKRHFKLKTGKETHAKMIEVFSSRNDISQRREMVDVTFKLFFKNYPFAAPEKLVNQEETRILDIMQISNDYNVYKAQADFKFKIRMLAERQVKEYILIDFLTCQEQIEANEDDVMNYLNLTKRPRMKDFIHFNVPSFKDKVHEVPIPNELIRFYCSLEKSLNYVIGYLSKRA